MAYAALALAACGYHLDSPRLPDNAGTVGLGTIGNRTTTGELDIRLQQLLRYRLSRHSTFDLVANDRADMSIEVVLNDLRITRSRDLTSTNVTGISYTLSGQVSLLDRRRGVYYVYRVPINGSAQLSFDAPVTETPAVRDQVLNDVLTDFATNVETLVLQNF